MQGGTEKWLELAGKFHNARGRFGNHGHQFDALDKTAAQVPLRGETKRIDGRGGQRYDCGESRRSVRSRDPTIPDADINSHPIPRMPDGHVDLTGPWVGGGSNGDIERAAGSKHLDQVFPDFKPQRVGLVG